MGFAPASSKRGLLCSCPSRMARGGVGTLPVGPFGTSASPGSGLWPGAGPGVCRLDHKMAFPPRQAPAVRGGPWVLGDVASALGFQPLSGLGWLGCLTAGRKAALRHPAGFCPELLSGGSAVLLASPGTPRCCFAGSG